MTRLISMAIASLDGYVEDESGSFGWAMPDEEVHRFVNELERPVGTYLYGRRMYETMRGWETAHTASDLPPFAAEFAEIWRAADKIVYSRTLEAVSTEKTRLERAFDPEAVRQLKRASDRDLAVGGSELAGQAIAAGLVDELHLLVVPVLVGGGKPSFPVGAPVDLVLLEERRFARGTVFLRYRVRP